MTADFEREFFRTLNRAVEPWVAVGLGSTGLSPLGIVLIETKGRRTGILRRTPLLACLVERHLIVTTLRGSRSQWWRNLVVEPETRAWILGAPRHFTAAVYPVREGIAPLPAYPPAVVAIVAALVPWAAGDLRFAVLAPAFEPTT